MAVISYDGIERYKGCVIRTWEHNGYHDSDFYADVIDIESGTIQPIEYATTRCGCGGYAEVDVTIENYRKFMRKAFRTQLDLVIREDKRLADRIEIGKEVKVIAGRKVPLGVQGTVFWLKEINYDPYGRFWGKEVRIGIKDKDGQVFWTYKRNLKIVDPSKYRTSTQELVKKLKQKRSRAFKRIFGIDKKETKT